MNRGQFKCGIAVLLAASLCLAGEEEANPLSGKPVAELAAVLAATANEMDRLNAVKALDELVPQKQDVRRNRGSKPVEYPAVDRAVIEVLVKGLHDPASSVRYVCRKALGRSGAAAIEDLVAALSSDDVDVRSYAADALGDMGVYADAEAQPLEKAVPALTKLLSDKHYAARVSAAMAMSHIGVRAAPALPQLIKLLDDKEWAVADAAVQAVAAADPEGRRSVPALVKVLGSRKHDLREFVCNELAAMGPKAKAAIPALIKLLDTDRESWQAGKAAANALASIISVDKAQTPAVPVTDQERRVVVAAIAQSAAKQKYPFMQDDRLFVLFPTIRHGVANPDLSGDLGREALPALPLALARLKAWMRQPPSPWIPRKGLVDLLALVGAHAKTEVVPVVKELLANSEIDEKQGRKQLEDLLKALEGPEP